MKYVFDSVSIIAGSDTEKKAAQILCDEIEKRTNIKPEILNKNNYENYIALYIKDESNSEDFAVEHNSTNVVITAHRLRGLIYGIGWCLRKLSFKSGKMTAETDISCNKSPAMRIRGHQLSYTDMNNTFDAWTLSEYRQYVIELMFFGMNIIEGVSGKERRNKMMHYSFADLLAGMSEICAELDIEFSLWHPFSSELNNKESLDELNSFIEKTKNINILFPPGGDPGDLQAEDFIERCKYIKNNISEKYPNMELWPSAQAPHEYSDWGERLKKEMSKCPDEVDGMIFGPNHAMPLDEMRRSIDLRYPIRFYPDLTHNVRCEIPVHFNRDDWHYAYAATLSREAVNPRPVEYRLLHRLTRQYVCGGVSYSEGVNDDVNKTIFSVLDFEPEYSIREALKEYARAYIPCVDCDMFADAVFGLEENWNGDPAENSSVENTYRSFEIMANNTPSVLSNWRFVLHYFRASCDKLVRDRRLFELGLIQEAKKKISKGEKNEALQILKTDFDDAYKSLRAKIDTLAEKSFRLIKIQLDVEHYNGMSWERGCTLNTIDNPVTDRKWLVEKLTEDINNAEDYFNRNKVASDEYYFSFAEHGFDVCGKQSGEYYYDFCGDSNFDSALPMCMTKVYDHFNFKCNVAGLVSGDYKLRISYKTRPNEKIKHHRITVNGTVIHDGGQFGGVIDKEFTDKFLAPGHVCVCYDIKKECFENGCAEISITEPLDGFMFSEFRITKN